MDWETMQARINAGLGKAAAKLGQNYQLYRPTDPLAPLATVLGTVQAVVSEDPEYSLRAPAGYGNAVRYLLADCSALCPGDVLISGMDTLFVAAVRPATPVLSVSCNTRLTIRAPVAHAGYGGGSTRIVAASWPASLLLQGRSDSNAANLPTDTHNGGWRILMPSIPDVALDASMVAIDSAGRRLILAAVEQTALGYRISATYGGA